MKNLKSLIGGLCLMTLMSCGGNQTETAAATETADEGANGTIETIMSRRSIRKYKDQPVERELLEQIAVCSMNAPSARNEQSWEVRFVDNAETLETIKNLAAEGADAEKAAEIKDSFRGGPVVAFVAYTKEDRWSSFNCGLLVENMMLAAKSLGLGSVCLGIPARFINESPKADEIRSILKLSPNYELTVCVTMGYPDEAPESRGRDESRVTFID